MKNEYDYLNDVRTDFSKYETMELTDKERREMKNEFKKRKAHFSWRKCSALAACAAAIAIAAQTGFAQNMMERIINVVQTGHNDVVQTDYSEAEETLTQTLKGCIFDKDGNEITSLDGITSYTDLYDASGVRYDEKSIIKLFKDKGLVNDDVDAIIRVGTPKEKGVIPESGNGEEIFTSIEELGSRLNFTLKTPEYMPEGWDFLYCYGFTGDDGVMSGNYAVLVYYDGNEEFYIHERVINDDTRYTASTDETVTEGTVNGCTAAISEHDVMWEQDGVSVDLVSGESDITGGMLLKVANSVR